MDFERVIDRLKLIRHTQIIEDPFKDTKCTNIYEAYQKGYNKAYKEIEEYILRNLKIENTITKGLEELK